MWETFIMRFESQIKKMCLEFCQVKINNKKDIRIIYIIEGKSFIVG
jgi:hypothetical protein